MRDDGVFFFFLLFPLVYSSRWGAADYPPLDPPESCLGGLPWPDNGLHACNEFQKKTKKKQGR